MTSLDVRDMLDLPSAAGPRPSKKQKAAGPRPNLKGLQREVQSLKGDNPIAIVPEVPQFKKRRFTSRKPARSWELKAFKTTTRTDGLVLHHWRPKSDSLSPASASAPVDGEAAENVGVKQEPAEESLFAKYNVQIERPTYNDEQYESNLRHDDWTRDETDYLMDLTTEFDLRWMIIWDRYEYKPKPPVPADSMELGSAVVPAAKQRSMEELKSRYYTVAAKMFCVNRPLHNQTPDEYVFHESMVNFDPAQETARKHFAETSMNRTDSEKKEEEMLLVELKRIVNRTEQLNQERKELYARLDTPNSSSNIGMFSSSQGLQTLLQTLLSADKNKKRKTLMAAEGASSPAVGPGPQQVICLDRRDSQRESMSGPSAAAKKPTGLNERRKLSEEEEAMYGITHHERLTGGPSFRHEKVTKLLSTRSATQATKLSNALTELEIPSRLAMPTTDVVAAFEQLVGSINLLLEARKMADKIDGEIRLEEVRKEERLAAKAATAATAAGKTAEPGGAVKETEGGDANASDLATHAGSVRKRSASILSTHSDKSSKRQKK